MILTTLDWGIIIFFLALTLFIGLWVSRQSGKSSAEYFLSGRNMPWWLLGMSMVATTFSTDTPNLVTDIVRQNGVSGNWTWWVFLLTGMLTVFVYAKLWRKSNVTTDIEFYELRYSGPAARFLRGFRSVFLGLFFNVLAMSAVSLAAIKIGGVMLGLTPLQTIGIASVITVIFSSLGGFKGVVYTDFILFFVAMTGAIGAAYYSIQHPDIGSLHNLVTHENVINKLNIFPDLTDRHTMITLFIIPFAVQWWNSWYPGAEPGGGGYIAQRMLASKDENHAIGATFFFNALHYALRPWPWIIVALCSLVVFPDLQSLSQAFPNISPDKLGNDLAYPAMLTFLPVGFTGLVLASLISAYMSTISTHLNWGASYLVNDFYARFINQDATEKQLVAAGRLTTVILMALGAGLALVMTNALQIFEFILAFGAGTGLIFLLRWFWWRINAWSEITAMFSSGIISIIVNFVYWPENWDTAYKFLVIVLITTIIWVIATFVTKPEDKETLYNFYQKIQPGGPGWNKIIKDAKSDNVDIVKNVKWTVPDGILAMLYGSLFIYALLFATGNVIYGNATLAILYGAGSLLFGVLLIRIWRKVRANIL
ncbi:Na+:solute symporter [Membranicola marinus]|uniref:Na+:solute symporter n=1 Tax=Membranihabitans marinus TaxID=1227546 RepID=A0A953HKZ6_9BACT|nr:sodium:solute symporter family protein [Membranihabitans marinus]MBY5956989.1 Na+:solute symporter [Membranihabitans marinus]